MRWLASGSMALATLALVLGCAANGFWLGALVAVLLGALWLAGWPRGWDWANPLALVGNVTTAALGVWLGGAPWALLLGVVATLAAWDLCHFAAQLRHTPQVIGEVALVTAHLRRLGVATGAGLLLGGLALTLRLGLSFGPALALLLLAGLGLRALGRAIQHAGEE